MPPPPPAVPSIGSRFFRAVAHGLGKPLDAIPAQVTVVAKIDAPWIEHAMTLSWPPSRPPGLTYPKASELGSWP